MIMISEVTLAEALNAHKPLLLYQPMHSDFWSPGNSCALISRAIELLAGHASAPMGLWVFIDDVSLVSPAMVAGIQECADRSGITLHFLGCSDDALMPADSSYLLCIPFDPSGAIAKGQSTLNAADFGVVLNLTLHSHPAFAEFLARSSDTYSIGAMRAAKAIYLDRQSAFVFQQLMNVRSSGIVSELPCSNYPQYLHPEVLWYLNSIDSPAAFIDCGSTDGGEIKALIDSCPTAFSRVLAFDPGSAPRDFVVEEAPVSLRQAAVLKSSGRYFLHGTGIGARVLGVRCADTDVAIEAISIDDLVNVEGLTSLALIRMDIEGSEVEALMGASDAIAKLAPALIICLYHRPDDIVTIPLLIAAINPGYLFYIGHHNPNCFYETVLYCVPMLR